MGSWAWQRVSPLLEAAGHRVTAIDLPGYGDDATPVADITLQAYADKSLAAVDAASEPAVLVGHSMGGIVVSTAAEQQPDRITAVVYVAAYMLPAGESVFSFSQSTPEFAGSKVVEHLRVDEASGTSQIAADALGPVFVNDGSEDDVALVTANAHVDFLAPSGTPVAVTDERWGRVRRAYVHTRRDQAVPYAAQQRMNELLPGAERHKLDTGHSPFLTAPQDLTDVLTRIAS